MTPKPPVENDEYAAFVRRIFRAYARRIASGDIDALAGMVAFTADIEDIIYQVVIGLREQHGYSWAEIGLRLGVTRQADNSAGETPGHDTKRRGRSRHPRT